MDFTLLKAVSILNELITFKLNFYKFVFFKMVAGITTYMVIFIQFMPKEDVAAATNTTSVTILASTENKTM